MIHLLDSGVLLRLVNRSDPNHLAVRKCLRTLRLAGDRLAAAPQCVAEFWNVSTRPATARGGYGLSIADTERRLKIIEGLCDVIPDSPNPYTVWRQLVVTHSVRGAQVHDARLVAWMKPQAVPQIITFNTVDYARYPGIVARDPITL